MSVKKIGKAILNPFLYSNQGGWFSYKVEGGIRRFTSERLHSDNLPEIQLLGVRPEYIIIFGEDPQQKKEYDEYIEKAKELIPQILARLYEETSVKPLLLFLTKDGSCMPGYPGELIYCMYRDTIYKFDRVGYSEEEMLLQILDLEDRERRRFERLKINSAL